MITPTLPPHSVEAEQSVLGGLLLDNGAWDAVIAGMLTVDDFYLFDHQVIFGAIAQLARENKPFDVITVAEKVEPALKRPEMEGHGLAYLGELAANTPSAANIHHYAEIVKERTMLRGLMQAGLECSRKATERGAGSAEVQEHIERRLYSLSKHRQGKDFIDVRQGLVSVIDTIDRHFQSGDPVTGVTTGLADLDDLTAGLQPGDLAIVAARPSMGKTAFAMGLLHTALERYPEHGVQFYSLEMPATQILFRMLGQYALLPVRNLMQGRLADDDWSRLTEAMARIDKHSERFALDDTSALTPTALRAKARRGARRYGTPKLIVVDYLQLMRVEGRPENRNLEITEISGALKALAKEMECPVVALSQLNRSLEQRANKRPLLSDLRESGAIEQDADLIMFIYRDEVYNPDSSDRGTAEIIVGKHRNGPTGVVRAAFVSDQARFVGLSKDYYSGSGRSV